MVGYHNLESDNCLFYFGQNHHDVRYRLNPLQWYHIRFMADNKENAKTSLIRKSGGGRWIPFTKESIMRKVFPWHDIIIYAEFPVAKRGRSDKWSLIQCCQVAITQRYLRGLMLRDAVSTLSLIWSVHLVQTHPGSLATMWLSGWGG